ncbi:class I SAM-dependent methyltransferase [Rhodovulum sulfidophilum]|uniref:class I SAM-dependent methyltransferase n=2 Tax=Rhodovulum sulfidophilum TaxID=35806 RepID=UPI001C4B1906|nr:class I SAM-dependent methyltransferase [Rhodovulum sulfidophilum]
MVTMSELDLRKNVYGALKAFQDSLRNYRRETGSPPTFLINGEAPAIPGELLKDCKVLPRREDIIADLPKGGIGVEIGTQTGRFARKLLDIAEPEKLFLLDLDYTPFQRDILANDIEAERVVTMQGSSLELMEGFDDDYFDFAYIDAGHGYDMVAKDLAVSLRKVKPGGAIICNDFVVWSALEAIPYGVHKAVTETIAERGLRVTHFAFHPFGYSDIAFCNT